ncbi:MAG: transporter substrate-binding domain-containing protein [Desulfobacteraceae bacterium]|nr:transporter substrate-binding domain-containing protein [Desulfobacteraceae bacterium]
MEKKNLIIGMVAVIIMSVFPVYSQSITIVTEQYPPYNYKENGEIKGVSTEVICAVLKEAKIEAKFKLYPWARAYSMAKKEENVLIYSISRTPNREKLFKWVGVIAPIDFYIFALKERPDIQVHLLEDAKRYKIGAVREDALEQFLTGKGFTKIYKTYSNEAVMKWVFLKRVELWPISEFTAYYYLKKNGHSPSEIKKVFHLKGFSSGHQYVAFGNATSDSLVNLLKSSLKKVKDKGDYQDIINKYVN